MAQEYCSSNLLKIRDNTESPNTIKRRSDSQERTMYSLPKSILVVEDDHGIRSLLELILRRGDRSVLLAKDGVEGLSLAKHHDIDLALVDVHMPGLDGASFCRAYRERGGEAPVVMLSAAVDGPDAAKACAADGFIAKPFQIATILDTVNRHLGTA